MTFQFKKSLAKRRMTKSVKRKLSNFQKAQQHRWQVNKGWKAPALLRKQLAVSFSIEFYTVRVH
jgi:hypothetical protein